MRARETTGSGVWRRGIFWLGSFASIASLLGHLYALAPMWQLALVLWLPLSLAMLAVALWTVKAGDEDFLLRLRAGFLGGLWGTLGYDLVRVPLHLLGANPLTPIRAYGIWLAGAGHSTPGTDLLGLAYHFSNGITFGWIYAFLMLRRHWLWGIAWGLLLETLAVLTPFGEVFALRRAYGALSLAFAAHLFYGYPLGRVCQQPEVALQAAFPLHRTRAGLATLALLAAFLAWFLFAWQIPGRQPALRPAEVVVGPDALYPGWSDLPLGAVVALTNTLPDRIQLRLRAPGNASAMQEMVLDANATRALRLDRPGIYQLLVPGRRWRSIFLAVRKAGDYRPVTPPSSR